MALWRDAGAMEFIGTYEMAAMLGLGRERTSQLAMTKGFPEPAIVLAIGRIYRTADFYEWAERVGRKILQPPRPPSWADQ